MKTRAFFLVLWMLTVALASAPAVQAQAPTIAYQGYLTDTDGEPATGTTSVGFSLYDDRAGGTRLWQEVQTNIEFTDGVFSVQLGSVEPLDSVPFDGPLWLSVRVDGTELSPRVPLSAVPYAMSVQGLRVVPGLSQIAPSPSLIGGHVLNAVEVNVNGATIGGGGSADNPNVVTVDFGTIGGGLGNLAGSIGTVGGGSDNVAGARATVGGGSGNTASGQRSTIGGGISNEATAERATVGGGADNVASGERSTIGGGDNNEATGEGATIGGGQGNNAQGVFSNIAGGSSNRTGSGQNATIAGGISNLAEGAASAVGGGGANRTGAEAATVPGGLHNWAMGRTSLAAGRNARALHDGTFVWGDRTDADFESTGENQFLLRATGGVGIGTNAPHGTLHITEVPLGLTSSSLTKDALAIEGSNPLITMYGKRFLENTRSGLILAGVDDNGNVEDRWGIVRQFFPGVGLHFTYGDSPNPTQNPSLMSLTSAVEGTTLGVSGRVRGETLQVSEDLGSSKTPTSGGVYRDNVVYAWAEVGTNGQFVDGFGCTVERTSRGMYRLTLKRSLPNGVSVIVTPRGLGSPFVASAIADGTTVDVAMRRFGGSTFELTDNAFYLQVVGRP